MAPSDDPDVPALSAAERERLRPTVDAEAFERFLAEIPADVRPGVQRAAVLHFSRNVTMADIRDFLSAVGNDDAAAAIDRTIASRPPQLADAHPAGGPDPGTSEPTPPAERLFSMEPPESPRLRALWEAIEPQAPGSG